MAKDRICARIGCNEPESWHIPDCKGHDPKNPDAPKLVCAVMCEGFLAAIGDEEPAEKHKKEYREQQKEQQESIASAIDIPEPSPVAVEAEPA